MKSVIIILCLLFSLSAHAQNLYFPPIQGDDWETITPETLNWNIMEIENLYKFLEENKTKGFILLKDGKIVLEKYFDNFGIKTSWYWASAGKTLTAALIGIAQHEGMLSINDGTYKYLGEGWTSFPGDSENSITVRHQLTMTSGLDDTVDDLMCTLPECLQYMADAGTRWSYHNAPYTLLDKVVENATGKSFNNYFNEKLKNKIGMTGIWMKTGYNNVYYSNLRSMARFGILIQNNGDWDGKAVIADKKYFNEMVNTSQKFNQSYGYLWWLNGKQSFMMPELRHVFKGQLFPSAPSDVIAALGKNGQVLNVSAGSGIVFARMGDAPDGQAPMTPLLSNEIWEILNRIMLNPGAANNSEANLNISIHPNPASDYIVIGSSETNTGKSENSVRIYNALGECAVSIMYSQNSTLFISGDELRIDVSHLPVGVYFVKIGSNTATFVKW